ncbi:MAG: Gfo/Idh/MocA family oxidoreductase [Clostridia bacterium]|nr:Gfo/Idh/MocA family oxidoreductase [Clostridia bacterium]
MADILNAFMENQEKVVIDTDRKLRIGIIGTGGIANSHMKAYLAMPDVEIVAGCDLVPGRATAYMKRHGVVGAKTDYKDHREMLADKSLRLDAVSVCTYNRQHAPCAIDALNAGVNVLLEKPLCVTMDEAYAIREAEKASGKVLSIGFQPRFDANMQMIKKIVQSGELGKVYYIQTGGGRRRGIPIGNEASFIRNDTAGIGAMGDIGCYSLDMVLNAIGYPKPLTVTGYKSDFFGKDPGYCRYVQMNDPSLAEKFGVDDFAAGFIRLEGDIILDFRISWALNIDTPGDTLILGTKGGLRIPSTDCWNGSVGGPMKIYKEVNGEQTCVTVPIIKEPQGSPTLWEKKIRTFLDAIKNGTGAPVPLSQIIINQAIIAGIVESAELGREIEIKL